METLLKVTNEVLSSDDEETVQPIPCGDEIIDINDSQSLSSRIGKVVRLLFQHASGVRKART